MAKYTLLKMTQLILSSMDSDEINSIGDTTEAQQVVDIIETTFDHLSSTMSLPEHYDLFELDAAADATRPTLMYVPDEVERIVWVQYDNREDGATVRLMKPVYFLEKTEFFRRMNGMDSAASDIYQYNYLANGGQTFDVRGKNNAFPGYYTSVDDNALIFDNYKADIDTYLVGGKSFNYGKIVQVFDRSDDFVANFDDQQFQLFFNEAKSQCFAELKQITNAAAERRARQSKVHSVVEADRAETGSTRPPTMPIGRRRRSTSIIRDTRR